MRTRFVMLIMLTLISHIVLAQSNKTIITVLDFTMNGVSKHEMKGVISLLSSALFQTGKYVVIDVSERERLLKEMEFSVSECTVESCQLQMGRMLSAESIVLGQINKIGTRYVLSVKMLETETARTQSTADGMYANLDIMLDDIFNIANKLAGDPGKPTNTPAPSSTKNTPKPVPTATPTSGDKNIPLKTTEPTKKPEFNTTEQARGSFFAFNAELGAAFPVGEAGSVFSIGIPANFGASWNNNYSWGELSLLCNLGFIFQPTKEAVRYPYTLFALPLAAGVGYKTNLMFPFYLTAQITGGVIFYLCSYNGEYPDRKDGFYMDFYANLGLGAGIRLSPSIDLGLLVNSYLIFYDNTMPAVHIAPVASIGLKF